MREAELNRQVFNSVAAEYSSSRGLEAAEEAALARARPGLGPEPIILDLGVGTGRTIPALRALGGKYRGFDYSTRMVALCRQTFPDVDVQQGDVRAMPEVQTGSVDLVVFSFNGLDAMDHRDRLQSLNEIQRVLRPGGAFIFSSHNRAAPRERPWLRPDLQEASGFRWQRYLLSLVRHLRLRGREQENEEYAIRNDRAHDFAMLHYYILPDAQKHQLARAGYRDLAVFDLSGREITTGALSRNAWLYYLCHKSV